MPADAVVEFSDRLKKKLATEMPVFSISAATGAGCEALAQAIYLWIEEKSQNKTEEKIQEAEQEDLIDE